MKTVNPQIYVTQDVFIYETLFIALQYFDLLIESLLGFQWDKYLVSCYEIRNEETGALI